MPSGPVIDTEPADIDTADIDNLQAELIDELMQEQSDAPVPAPEVDIKL